MWRWHRNLISGNSSTGREQGNNGEGARGRLQEWEKHGRLRVFDEAVIFSLFRDAHHLDARSILYLVISTHCASHRTKNSRELRVGHRYPRRFFIVLPCKASPGQKT